MSYSSPRLDDGYDDDPGRWSDGEHFRVRHRRRRWGLWVLGFLTVVVVAGGLAIVSVHHDIDPGQRGAVVAFTIPPGTSTNNIATILGKAGVIRDPTVFRLYLKVEGAGALLAGQYHLNRNSSYGSVVTALENGPPIVYQKFTIPEGFSLQQIAARVGSLPGRSSAGFLAAARSGQVVSQYLPPGQTNLEGLLFPATYTVRADASDVSIVQMMVTTFDDNVANLNLTQAASTVGVSPYQVIIVASMVEHEAKLDEDRGPIASVIYNRLRDNMLLQIDSTLLYGQGNLDTGSTSPYNTYKYKGLPPTPIGNPGLPSLTAATTPPTTNYLYYRTINSAGKTGFAATSAGFAQLQAEARANGIA